MFAKIGHQLYQIHEKLKKGKDKAFVPLVRILPQWVLPNHVTLFRLIIVLVWLPFALFRPTLGQVAIFFIVGFFDLLDGAMARFKNQITYFGKYFDIISDRINHVALWVVVLGLTNHQFIILKFFIIWELAVSLYLVIEYFVKNSKFVHFRVLCQFCVRTTLWIGLIYELAQIYGG